MLIDASLKKSVMVASLIGLLALAGCSLSTATVTISTTPTATSPAATATAAPTATVPTPQAQVNFAFHDISVASGSTVHDQVACPSGTTLLGGGYVINTSVTSLVQADDSYPVNATTWAIDTRQGAPETLDVHVEAECLQANFTTTAQIAHSTTNADGGTVAATCPNGTIPSGGGYQAGNGTTIASIPQNNGWKYINAGLPGGSAYAVTAYAVCVSGAPLAAGSIVQQSLSIPANDATKGTYVSCPVGKLATGGGFDGSAALDLEGFILFGNNSGTNGPLQHPQGWGVFAENQIYATKSAPVYAVCLGY
jgi:hypothetical protein